MLINPQLLNEAPAQILVWSDANPTLNRTADRCERCLGRGELEFLAPRDTLAARRAVAIQERTLPIHICPDCNGVGWLGIDPHLPTNALPGSVEKLAVLVARQSARCKLWHPLDSTEPTDPQASSAEAQDIYQAPLSDADDDWEQPAIAGLSTLIESL